MASNAPAKSPAGGSAKAGGAKAVSATSPSQWAFRSIGAVILFVSVTAVSLAADLLSKHYVFEWLLNDPVLIDRAEQVNRLLQSQGPDNAQSAARQVLGCFQKDVFWRVKFSLSANPGVVFGWSLPRWAVIITTIVTIGLVGMFFAVSHRRAWSVHLALACVLAGALGNLYDRLCSEVAPLAMAPIRYNVRDFIDCSKLYYPWVFNVADVMLVVGVALLGLHWLMDARDRRAPAKAA